MYPRAYPYQESISFACYITCACAKLRWSPDPYVSFISYIRFFSYSRKCYSSISLRYISQRFSGCRYRPLSARNAGPGQIKTANASIYRRSDRMCCLNTCWSRARAHPCANSLSLFLIFSVAHNGKKERE